MHSQRTVLKLVEGMYDAASDRDFWPVFLDSFRQTLNAQAATFFVQDLCSQGINTVASVGIGPSYIHSYEEHYAAKNVYLTRGNRLLSTGRVCPSQMLCPDREALRSDFYNEWIAPQKQRHGLLGVLFREQSLTSMIGAIRSERTGPFGDGDLSLVRTLMPHLQRAVQLHRRIASLETKADGMSDALNRWSLGIILLDHEGRVLLMNRSAEAIVRKRDGLRFELRKLSAGSPSETAAFRALIHGSIQATSGRVAHPGGAIALSRLCSGRPLHVLVTPVVAHKAIALAAGAAAIVFVRDPEARVESDEELLRQLCGLSHAEARVASLLVQGKSVKALSNHLGVTMNTARTHLKRIFEKTGTNRQAQLMHLILQSPVSLQLKPST